MMFVNLGVSIAAVSIVVMRVYMLWFRYRMSSQAFADNIVAHVDQGSYANAIQTCSQKEYHPLAAITKDILLKADRSDKEIERAYETSAAREIPRFKRFTAFLPQAGNLGTLIGLLGTIHGLIEAFGGAQAEDAAQRQAVLAKGITVAFYNTFFGLSIAVFCAIAFIILNGRQGLLLEGIENALNRIRERIIDRNKAVRTARAA
ncbi:MAG: MotA/TolQ/ExbB proton channel family protein [Myxococcales bacterium]|nr:MotA/TolQ/ExbB proton channel family protein [Myxococcales bacterium]MCB9648088.1 MotA/TolQ/ExbB proton channel family protein [Deltaproteobacteria bacterium]